MRIRLEPGPLLLERKNRRWLLAVALTVASSGHPGIAAEPAQSELTARLGFRFDQRAHDVTVAIDRNGQPEHEFAETGIVKLPKYEVTARPLTTTEDELLTPTGRVELAKKRYLTPVYQKVFGPLAAIASLLNNPLGGWNPNGPEALAIYHDNLNLQRRKEAKDLAELAAFADQVGRAKAEQATKR